MASQNEFESGVNVDGIKNVGTRRRVGRHDDQLGDVAPGETVRNLSRHCHEEPLQDLDTQCSSVVPCQLVKKLDGPVVLAPCARVMGIDEDVAVEELAGHRL